jgi:hypothetical protein
MQACSGSSANYRRQARLGITLAQPRIARIATRGIKPKADNAVLEELPLGKAHLMTFQLTPIGPLNPLRQLLRRED